MNHLIEYNNYSKTSGRLWQYYRDEPALTDADTIPNFHAANDSTSFKFKQKMCKGANGRKDVKIIVPLKYLSNFWRTLEMSLINCEINPVLTWSQKCVLSNDTKAITFAITDTKLYIPVVTLSTQSNAKLLEQLKSGFKITINWYKYDPKVSVEAPNPYLYFLINPSFQGVNRLFVLSFENKDDWTVHAKHLPTVEIKNYNVMINRQNCFDQPVKNNLITYNIQKIVIG